MVDPSEIIKAVTEVATAAAPVAAGSIPFTGIVKRMLGPAADELAERWRDDVRRYRYGRQIRCVKKAEQMARDAGFTPKAVPIKLLFPLLEDASLEEDENLHNMWAALLANASSPDRAEKVRPEFLGILKQMSPDAAALLSWMVSKEEKSGYSSPISLGEIAEAYNQLGFGPVDVPTILGPRPIAPDTKIQAFGTCFTSLVANGLARRFDNEDHHAYVKHQFHVMWRGGAFIEACRPPKPKS